MSKRAIAVTGNPVDGLFFTGPFPTDAAAAAYCDAEHNDQDWWTAPLQPAPDVPDAAPNEQLFAVLRAGLEYRADQFDALAYVDRHIGADLVGWFAEWRLQVRSAVERCAAQPPTPELIEVLKLCRDRANRVYSLSPRERIQVLEEIFAQASSVLRQVGVDK